MFSLISSDISQNNAEIQRRHEEEQQLQACLEKTAEAYYIECTVQKVRKVAKAKAKEEAEKWRPVEKEDKMKWLEYLKQLWDEVLSENATLLRDTEAFQITGSKCKKVTTISLENKAR